MNFQHKSSFNTSTTQAVSCAAQKGVWTWSRIWHAGEHWLTEEFPLFRGDQTKGSGKKKGGGVCVFVNEKCCHQNNTTVKVNVYSQCWTTESVWHLSNSIYQGNLCKSLLLVFMFHQTVMQKKCPVGLEIISMTWKHLLLMHWKKLQVIVTIAPLSSTSYF